jgi:hypothetical protein
MVPFSERGDFVGVCRYCCNGICDSDLEEMMGELSLLVDHGKLEQLVKMVRGLRTLKDLTPLHSSANDGPTNPKNCRKSNSPNERRHQLPKCEHTAFSAPQEAQPRREDLTGPWDRGEELIGKIDFDLFSACPAQGFFDFGQTIMASRKPMIDREARWLAVSSFGHFHNGSKKPDEMAGAALSPR